MTEEKPTYQVLEVTVSAVKEGAVSVRVVKAGTWFDLSWNRQNVRMGAAFEPLGNLIVEVPVEGVAPETPLNVEQAAQYLQTQMKMLLPACKVFVSEASADFGYVEEEDY